MTPEQLAPVLLAVAGSILAAAGLLIVAGHRRRSYTALGVLVLLAGVVTVSPSTASATARTAVAATAQVFGGLTGGPPTTPAPGEVIAVETPEAG
ncbi:hypothetical protein LQU92_01160 [Kocuria sp. LUK]|uniref:Uncharacterized protein n=1 Tax=Kocuria flava TaxID=446860 RepID=A0A2N4T3I0_9MICC|nr:MULTISPECIES: hypothetical protein [Kocuria]MCD1143850.1 hypothetical protein [Kocuria sp. LUK]PLC12763.1 hypothetical protein AUQ48_11710 [Kocuria flava]